MDILIKSLSSLWQVVAVGLLLGAGLPALFALGMRSLSSGRVLVTAGGTSGTEPVTKPSPLALTGAAICFGLVTLAVLLGIVVIIFGKQLFG